MAKRVIYARVSTDEQATAAQAQELSRYYPDAAVVSEVKSSMKRRPILEALIASLEPGDTLVVYALDRLGRRVTEVLQLIEGLQAKGIRLVSHREGVDYSTPVGRLVTQILVSVAEMERARISERTKTGLAAAKAQGRLGGRPSKITSEQYAKCFELRAQGFTIREIGAETGLPYATVGRLLKQVRD